ncbi:unnamed protein product [Tenebrio molitor]|nr:unnamed protein product [Tenebrio molitor]
MAQGLYREKFPQILETVSQFGACPTLNEQGLYPYHVQREQVLQPNDCIRQQEFWEGRFKSASINLFFAR